MQKITGKEFLRIWGCFLFLSFSVFWVGDARAANFSGEYLYKVCSVDGKGNETVPGGKIACQSYISGVIDYHNMLRAMDLTSDMNFCIPKGITLNEIQLRVLVYLKKNLKLHRKFVAAPAVSMALFSFYPCNK